jgi:hypothetical protein
MSHFLIAAQEYTLVSVNDSETHWTVPESDIVDYQNSAKEFNVDDIVYFLVGDDVKPQHFKRGTVVRVLRVRSRPLF